MKKIFLSISILLSLQISFAQNNSTVGASKKFTQLSLRGGFDVAKKDNFTNYVKMPLKGFEGGVSVDKYWGWYGLGIDADYLQNKKPVYNDNGLDALVAAVSMGTLIKPVNYTSSTTATKLNRVFVGIGPSFKHQSNNNKFIAELNLRGGVTLTDGSSLKYSTLSGAWAWWMQRDGDATAGPLSFGTFYHKGYTNELLATAKAQVRFNYYFKPKLAINVGAYYMYYFGSKARYTYLDWNATGSAPYWTLNTTPGLTALTSMGVTAGISYRLGGAQAASKVKAKNNLTVLVKDELTNLPLADAIVTITNNNGKTYTATTNAVGNAVFNKIEEGNYNVTGTLHDISTTNQNVVLGSSNRNATATLVHNDPRFTVIGKAINLSLNRPEADVTVTLRNNSKGSVKMSTTQSNTGSFGFQIDANSDYEIVGKKASYISNIEKISTKGLTRSQTLYVELELGVLQVEKGKALLLNKIYYDLDKADIREDASTDLEKLIIFLNDNPSFNVEIASHTDSRGASDYNQKLSQDRAQSVVNYLTQKGIAKERLLAKGYGETQLINKCADGVSCTETEHQENRRTEFKVLNN